MPCYISWHIVLLTDFQCGINYNCYQQWRPGITGRPFSSIHCWTWQAVMQCIILSQQRFPVFTVTAILCHFFYNFSPDKLVSFCRLKHFSQIVSIIHFNFVYSVYKISSNGEGRINSINIFKHKIRTKQNLCFKYWYIYINNNDIKTSKLLYLYIFKTDFP